MNSIDPVIKLIGLGCVLVCLGAPIFWVATRVHLVKVAGIVVGTILLCAFFAAKYSSMNGIQLGYDGFEPTFVEFAKYYLVNFGGVFVVWTGAFGSYVWWKKKSKNG